MIFKVIDNRTGKEPIYDFNHLFKEKWFKESGLIYCDISGWIIDEEGFLALTDDCNNMAYPPSERFSVVFDLSEINERFNTDYISKSDLLRRIDEERKYLIARGLTGAEHIITKAIRDLIDTDPEEV